LRLRSHKVIFFAAAVALIASLIAHQPTKASQAPISFERGGVVFEQLADAVWMHTSYKELPGWGPVPSNGLVVVSGGEAVLVDTAWNDEQTGAILDWAAEELRSPIARAVFTHAHEDKMGGVAAVRARGVQTFAHPLSNAAAALHDLEPAEYTLSFDQDGLAESPAPLVVYYPGPGHTQDNIVVEVPGTKVLFGGCLIRPPESTSLGNTTDANIGNWDDAVINVKERFPNAEIVVPSHGRPGGRELFDLTVKLAKIRFP
jgi:glyoxylase-like metal-dependent hydrolase (beta-lactamase superfamily II)